MEHDQTAERAAALTCLQREIRACEKCVRGGYLSEAHPVLQGTVEQRMMVVGQAPGVLSWERPAPYLGATGKTLRAWLAQAGFPDDALHSRFYLTSLTKCFPGPSGSGKGDRPPSATEIALCQSWLEQELSLVRPELVLSLGRLATTALVGPAPLRDLVGAAHLVEHTGYQFLVLPLPHPSGVSRWLNDPINRACHARAIAELAALRERLGL